MLDHAEDEKLIKKFTDVNADFDQFYTDDQSKQVYPLSFAYLKNLKVLIPQIL